MKRFGLKSALFALLVAIGVATAADDKGQTIKQCMKCQNTSKAAIEKSVKAEKWDDAVKTSKTWLKAAEDLGKNKPKKGDEDSWKEKTGKYLDTVKDVSAAVEKKDAEATTKGLKAVGGQCGDCHKAHK